MAECPEIDHIFDIQLLDAAYEVSPGRRKVGQ